MILLIYFHAAFFKFTTSIYMLLNYTIMITRYFIFLILTFVTFLVSCDKDNVEDANFHKLSHRIGLWVSTDQKDTLDFVDSSTLIRKGYYYNEKYKYKIKEKTLFIYLFSGEEDLGSQHQIIEAKNGKVHLSNMFIVIGFDDGSIMYYKVK